MPGGLHAGLSAELTEWLRYLQEIGVRDLRFSPSTLVQESPAAVPLARPTPPTAAGAASSVPGKEPSVSELFTVESTPPPADPAKRLAEIRDELGDCTRCKLCKGRQKIVFGVGDPKARLMFVGEGPGAEEDARGEPFVGRAGKKLDEMIQAIGLQRSEVYIANIVKCRPPDNRDPQPDEVGTCAPFLRQQIEAIRPAVIVTLGSPASKTLLDTKVGITKLRGTWHECAGIPVMPTFHPAYLLRAYTVENRTKVWEDLKAARSRMDRAQ